MTIRWPEGLYTYKEDFLKDFKEINRVKSMDEEAFLEAVTMHKRVVYLDTTKNIGHIEKRSVIKESIIRFMTWFVSITDRILK